MTDQRLRRLLGPNRPELTCEQCFADLPHYVEFQLATDQPARFQLCPACITPGECAQARDCLGMQAHLAGCPACDEEHQTLHALVQAEPSQ